MSEKIILAVQPSLQRRRREARENDRIRSRSVVLTPMEVPRRQCSDEPAVDSWPAGGSATLNSRRLYVVAAGVVMGRQAHRRSLNGIVVGDYWCIATPHRKLIYHRYIFVMVN